MKKRTYRNETTIVDTGDLETVRSAMRPNTRLVHIETPGNSTMAVCDIWGIAEITHAEGTLLSVDNTFASPYNQRPLELGADFFVSAWALKTQRTSLPTWTRP
jgi:methionine-gamma-lyase